MSLPNKFYVPSMSVTFDSTPRSAAATTLDFQALLVGTIADSSTMLENKAYQVYNADSVGALAGFGTQLHILAVEWFAINTGSVLKVIGLKAIVGATAATRSFTLSGAITTAGTYKMYINQDLTEVTAALSATPSELNTLMVAAINAQDDCPLTASNTVTETIVLTTKSKGLDAGAVDVRLTYYDTDIELQGVETVETFAAGTLNPDLTDMLTAIKNDWYQVLVIPFSDLPTLQILKTEMLDRFDPLRSMDGMLYFGHNDTQSNTIAFATSAVHNCQSLNAIDTYLYPNGMHNVATAWAAAQLASIENDIGQPLHNIVLPTILPPVSTDQKSVLELNELAKNGVSCLDPRATGGAATFGTVTMYLKNTYGVIDTAYRKQVKMFIMMYCRYDFVSQVKSIFGRCREAATAKDIDDNIQVLTPKVAVSFAIKVARIWSKAGLINDLDYFIANVSAWIPDDNDNQMVWYLPTDFINQFVDGRATMKTDK